MILTDENLEGGLEMVMGERKDLGFHLGDFQSLQSLGDGKCTIKPDLEDRKLVYFYL